MERKIEIIREKNLHNAPNGILYNIFLGNIATTWHIWFKAYAKKQIVIICDKNTEQYCLPLFLEKTGIKNFTLISVAAGELYKNNETCNEIWSKLLQNSIDRKALCINLGGGVIGDMGGFCAATFKRGFDFVQVPTTLLSQVDSSIGGKLGIDFQGVKNCIGVFQDPKAVFIDTDFLNTLSLREIRSGFAEMIKHTLIADVEEWNKLLQIEEIEQTDWQQYLEPSLCVKRKIVEQDPYEKGIRKALNFGHTIGHAVESYFLESEMPLLHGEAIAIGMICEAYLSYQNDFLSKEELEQIVAYFKRFYPKTLLPSASFDTLFDTMLQDKKNENQAINFTFLDGIGNAKINQTVDNELIINSLIYYNEHYCNYLPFEVSDTSLIQFI
jgi:3-dehydroquinate synthase